MEIKIDNVNMVYYDNIEKALIREDNFIRHPRTQELIIGCTFQSKQKVYHKKHLGRFPTVAFHRRMNRVQESGSFAVHPLSKGERELLGITPTDTTILNQRLKGELSFRNTSQYKSVWYQKHQRRQ